MFEKLDIKEWLELNAKLQQKKNTLRTALQKKGVLKRNATNEFDKYKYFSEAQYKELFTELLSQSKLELKFNELEYSFFEGTEKQANGRMPKLEFQLIDCETGFYETTVITSEAIDKGDKAGYKAYTGALKYYLANTFMVATGDDPEKESPAEEMKKIVLDEKLIEEAKQIGIDDLTKVAKYFKKKVESLTNEDLKSAIEQKKKMMAHKTTIVDGFNSKKEIDDAVNVITKDVDPSDPFAK